MNLTGLIAKIKEKAGGENGRFAGDLGFKAVTELCNALFGILTFAILSRLLSKSDYAVVNQTIAISSLIAPIILLKMNSAFCVFLAGEKDQEIVKSRFFSVLLVSLPFCALVLAVMWIFGDRFSDLMFSTPEYGNITPLMALYFVLLSLSSLVQTFYQAINRQKKSNVFILLRVVLTTFGFAALSLIPGFFTLPFALLVYVIVEGIVFLFSFFSLIVDFHRIPLHLEFLPLEEYYRYALPLMPFAIMGWINSFIGRFILNHLMDLENSGIFSFDSALISRAFFINAVIVYTIFPYISKFWNEGNKSKVVSYLRKATNIGVFFALPLTFGIVAVAPTIVEILSGGNYPTDRLLLGLICFANLFLMLYTIYSFLIDLSRRTMLYNVIFLISSLINIGLNYLLIPIWGLYGAGAAMLISYIIQFFLTLFIGNLAAQLQISIDWPFMLRSLVCSLFMFLVCLLVYGEGGLLRCILTVIIGCIVYFSTSYAWARLTRRSLIWDN